MLGRILPHLQQGAVIGIVVPQGFLHSKNATNLRSCLARELEFAEICLFPDKVFTFSDMESAIILARKSKPRAASTTTLRYRRVRERDANRFKQSYAVTTERQVLQARFRHHDACEMRIPDLDEVWSWSRGAICLSGLAEVGQGLIYKGRDLPRGAHTVSNRRFRGAVRGYAGWDRRLMIHQQPEELFLSLDPEVIRRPVTGTVTRVPQVLLNYQPVSRGPWRLKALIDEEGHAVTSHFLTIRTKLPNCPLHFLWAICNSPFANAYAYAHLMKRNILAGAMRAMPIPSLSEADMQGVVDAAEAYLREVRPSQRILQPEIDDQKACSLLLHMDAEVLRLYDLPPRLERQLLDLFNGHQRAGVPFKFDRYFPEDFEPCFPLHEYLSDAYRRSTAGELRKKYKPVTNPVLLAAMRASVEAFEE